MHATAMNNRGKGERRGVIRETGVGRGLVGAGGKVYTL